MPVVSRADCTEIRAEEEYTVAFLGTGTGPTAWSATLDYIDITFAACQGENNENNDLWAYFRRLYLEKKVSADQLAALSRTLVEEENCPYAIEYMMSQKGYQAGFDPNIQDFGSNWKHLAGRDSLAPPGGNLGGEVFDDMYNASSTRIIERVCASCLASHQIIYLRYADGYRPQANILNWLKTSYPREEAKMGKYGVNWALYSTYQDALNRTNPWVCTYDFNSYFPGNCAPNGQQNDQGSLLERSWGGPDGRTDVGYYMESGFTLDSVNRAIGSVIFNGTQIGPFIYGVTPGSFQTLDSGTMYVRGSGLDIWGKTDSGFFVYHNVTNGNLTLKIHIDDWDDKADWSKGCLMLRKSLDVGSPYFATCIYGMHGFGQQWRDLQDGDSGAWNNMYNQDINTGWIMFSKKGLTFTTYLSTNGQDWYAYGMVKTMPDSFASASGYLAGFMLSPNNPGLVAEAQLDTYGYYPYASKLQCAAVPDN